MLRSVCLLIALLLSPSASADKDLQFGVVNLRSVLLTVQLWNPILAYVTEKTGVPLVLKMGKTADETTVRTVHGDFDFVFTNHLFTPERNKLGYRVIARFDNEGIRGLVVVLASSPYTKLSDLQGKVVAFPTPNGFGGYALPMDGLQKAGVVVDTVFMGNQEAALSNLQYGKTAAAGVNNITLANYSRRESLAYRVLYQSAVYYDVPIMAHPRVPAVTANKVRQALVGMAQDARGQQILLAASVLLNMDQSLRFVSANNEDYENYREFYRHQKTSEH